MGCSIRETFTREVNFYRSSSIDMMVSNSYAPAISAMESAAISSASTPLLCYNAMKPVFFDTGAEIINQNRNVNSMNNHQNNYKKQYDLNSAISYMTYSRQNYDGRGHQMIPQDNFSPDLFLKKNRIVTEFVGSSEEIKHYITEAFEKTTGKKLPEDFMIRVVDQQELRELHEEFGGNWSPGIQGFSINKKGFGQSMIFCKENELDRLLVTIGHEIGHIIEFPLQDKLDEEAKAFAFEMAWIKAMFEHNIAGLRESLNPDPMPAKNGLHDVAFDFVRKTILGGKSCPEIIKDLMSHRIKVRGEDNELLL
jgi:hypothetical protein